MGLVYCAMHKLESKITEIELTDPKLTSVYFRFVEL